MSTRGRQYLTLAISAVGAMTVALDGTVLLVVQPGMQRELHASFTQIQWTSTGYLVAVASLLVLAGRLGDLYGHRRMFVLGMLGFAAGSAGVGLAPGVGWVIGLRVVQGIFGALLQPATLGMLRAVYPRDRLGMPIAIRTSAIGVAAAGGPIVGGALASQLGWRAVFFLTVAPALAVALAALGIAPTVPTPTARAGSGARTGAGLDLPGACLLSVALACLIHALIEIPTAGGAAPATLGALVAVVLVGAAFVRHERRSADPLLPAAVLRSPGVTAGLGILLSTAASMFGALFVATYFLQDVLGLDPLASGLRVLPLTVLMVLGAPVAAAQMRRRGPRRTAVAGTALVALGILLLSRLDQGSGAVAIGGCFLVLGAGFGTVMVTATAVVVDRAPVDAAGVVGGLQQTAMNIGPALGVAAATTLMTLAAPDGAARHPGGAPDWSADGFTSAMATTLPVLAACAVLGTLLAFRLPGRAEAGQAAVRPDPTAGVRRRSGSGAALPADSPTSPPH